MRVFLWLIVFLGVTEMFTSIYWASVRKVPERSQFTMACNAAVMFAMGMWAFWLLSGGGQ